MEFQRRGCVYRCGIWVRNCVWSLGEAGLQGEAKMTKC